MQSDDIELLYAAMLGERSWDSFLERLAPETDKGKAYMQMYDSHKLGSSFVAVQRGFEDSSLNVYVSEYAPFNILQKSLVLKPNGVPFSDRLLIDQRARENSIFVNEWLVPNGVKASVGVKIASVGTRTTSLVLMNGEDDVGWRRRTTARLNALAPHLKRASDFFRRGGRSRHVLSVTDSMPGSFESGTMQLDYDRRIIFMTKDVLHFLEGANAIMSLDSSRLHFRDRTLAGMYDQLTDFNYKGPKTIDYHIPHMRISMVRLEQDAASMLLGGVSILVFLNAIKEGLARYDRKLVSLTYNLTPAEMRALDGLIAGKNAAQIAQQFGLSRETVRVQIRSLYAKTGARSEADVMRVLLPKQSLWPIPYLSSRLR